MDVSHQASSPEAQRPSKRLRMTPSEPQRVPHSRGATACQICRSRKTKCDGQRPTCGYCLKTRGDCSYTEDVAQFTACQVYGPQILEAIQNLTKLLTEQRQVNFQNSDGFPSISVDSPTSAQTLQEQHGSNSCHDGMRHGSIGSEYELAPTLQSSHRTRRVSSPAGLDSVLKWKIFPQPVPYSALPGSEETRPLTTQLPNLEYSELTRLESKYVAFVHTKNPILVLQKLHASISRLAENGLDWSTETCLVSLVCALGALSQPYSLSVGTPNLDPRPSFDDETKLANQYWDVAAKRLGFVVGHNSLEAVQCLCLAGIWYSYSMEPLQAWKYFNLASNSWYISTVNKPLLVPRSNDTQHGSSSLTVEQSLFFTCYKSECELTFELSLPESILEGIDYPHTFPIPPNLDHPSPDSSAFDFERRSWYYYLAEIACRHLINRILQVARERPATPSVSVIKRMLKDLEVFETQLNEWYSSLPPELMFPILWGTLEPLQDELTNHLRGRYLAIRELCHRPFVRLCVNHTLDIQPDLLAQVAAVASEGLRYCMFRLQSVPRPFRHHGLWFQLRIFTTGSLILIAADRAQRDPMMNVAHNMEIPVGWREQISKTGDMYSPYWNERRGGIWESSQILQWALEGCGE